ncbi:MAG TPA: GPP34 family phosphoprotein [Candidatus Stackebrandtia excrementipullorum]|nr:GPP34 family phosphoprotein [Candidatus Stackebrandtia excrementipullorum]
MARDALPLADQLFLAAVDPRSGHLAIDQEILGVGLTAIFLAQLEYEKYIVISSDLIRQAGPRPRPHMTDGGVSIADMVLRQIAEEPTTWDASVWLRFWASDGITDRVAERLVSLGVLQPLTRRGLLNRRPVYRTVKESDQWWWRSRLRMFLTEPGRYTPTYMDLLMLGLGDAIGLRSILLADAPAGAKETLDETRRLPGSLGLLVRHAHVVAADAALS